MWWATRGSSNTTGFRRCPASTTPATTGRITRTIPSHGSAGSRKVNLPDVRIASEEYLVEQEPFYLPVGDEVALFEAAFAQRIPVLLKGPTGCGKTRFVEYMAWKLGTGAGGAGAASPRALPLVTISCHEDLTATDLVGRYLLFGGGT